MSKCSVRSVRNSRRVVWTLLRPKYCALAEPGHISSVVARHTNTVAHRNMGTPELIVEKRYFNTRKGRGLHTLMRDIGAIDGRNSDVSIADPTRNIETKRASAARIRAAEADANIHICNRTA